MASGIFEHEGKSIHYSCYVLTTLGHVSIPESEYFYRHPHFIMSAIEQGHQMETIGDMLRWLNAHHNNLVGSQYWDYLHECLYNIFVLDLSAPDGEKWTSVVSPDNKLFNYSVNPTGSNAPYVLLTDNTTPDPEYYVLDRFRNAKWGLIPRGAEDTAVNTSDLAPHHYRQLLNYTWRPDEFTFFKHQRDVTNESLFFGMEIEINTKISPAEMQDIVTTVEPKQKHFFYMKSDSSIGGPFSHSYEIVTMPCTPRFLATELRTLFDKIEGLCEEKGVSVDSMIYNGVDSNHGIHIHVSRDAFVKHSVRGANVHMNKFLTFWNGWDTNFLEFMKTMTKRRVTNKDSTYHRPHPAMEGFTLARRVRNGLNGESSHHSAADLTSQTVEVRAYQGITTVEHLLTCVQLTKAVFDFTAIAPLSSLKSGSHYRFVDWVFKQQGYKYAKERLNECVS